MLWWTAGAEDDVCVCVFGCEIGGALCSFLLGENPESHQVQTPASRKVSRAATNSCWTTAPHPQKTAFVLTTNQLPALLCSLQFWKEQGAAGVWFWRYRQTDRRACCVFAQFPVLPAAALLCGFIWFSSITLTCCSPNWALQPLLIMHRQKKQHERASFQTHACQLKTLSRYPEEICVWIEISDKFRTVSTLLALPHKHLCLWCTVRSTQTDKQRDQCKLDIFLHWLFVLKRHIYSKCYLLQFLILMIVKI